MIIKIPVLSVMRNGFDDHGHIFVNIIIGGLGGKSEEKILIMSRKKAQFLIQALDDALKSKKFINQKIIKRRLKKK